MSAVDERVVQMIFDNSRFESNVNTSISTLDKLNAALKLKGATESLDSVEKQAGKLDLSGIGSAVETISSKFSMLGMIGVTALQNIVNKAVDAGEKLAKSLSLDLINAGWDKYAEKTTSVQTIMAATEKTWEKSAKDLQFQGTQMEFVNSQMDKLNWFTDETSYSFTDMVSNIGKFTANNIPLETSVTAMQGIANWAAISGQNAGAASRAMYNLAQAIGVGSVKLMDWKSIENANMATAGFKERVLEVAAANGQLTKSVNKAGDTIYKTVKGTEVSVESFSQTLSEGWFDKNTLLSVLDDYGSFTNQLYEYSEATNLTATDILSLADTYSTLEQNAKAAGMPLEEYIATSKEGAEYTKKLANTAEEYGLNIEDLTENIANLGSETNKFGREAFKAAQEAKTFQDAIDATKDAASTRWMNIFENIFGDYEKARHVWTDFANFLYDIFVSPLEKLETISEYVSKWNGLDMIRDSFTDIRNFIKGGDETPGILSSFAKGFREIIPPLEITEAAVGRALYRIRHFAASLQLSEEQASRFQAAGKGLANILQFVGNSIRNVWDATSGLRSALANIAGAVGNLVLGLFGMASDMDTSGVKAEGFRMICDKLAEIINKLAEAIGKLDLDKLKQKFSGLSGVLKGVSNAFKWVIEKITSVNFSGAFTKAIDWIKGKFDQLKTYLSQFDLGKIFKGALGTGALALIGTKLVKSIKNISEPFKFLEDIKEKFSKFPDTIGKIFNGIGTALKSFSTSVKADAFKSISTGILLLAGALLVLGLVNYDNAIIGVGVLTTVLIGLFTAFKAIDKIDKGKMAVMAASMLMAAAAMLVMAAALATLAGALALFTLVARMDNIADGFALMAGTLAIALVSLKVLSKMSPKVLVAAAALAVFAAALLILAAAIAAFALVAGMENVWTGLGVMAAGLLLVVASLAVLSQVALGALAGAAALLIVSAALLVLAGAMAAFTAVAGMENFGAGVATMALTILILVAALIALGATGPIVLVGAAALLVAAAACLVLAVAVGVVAAVLPLLSAGLAALGEAIGSAVASIGAGVGEFLSSVASGIEAAGEALGQMVANIGSGMGEAISALGEGIADAIADIIASVGEGIAQGLQAISDAVSSFGESLTNAGAGIQSFGDGVRSLQGISWASTAIGVGELALALNKLDVTGLAENLGTASTAITATCTSMLAAVNASIPTIINAFVTMGTRIVTTVQSIRPRVESAAQNLGTAMAAGIRSKQSEVGSAARSLGEAAKTAISSYSSSWSALGQAVGTGFANGIRSKIGEVSAAASAMAAAAERSISVTIDAHSPSKVTTRLGEYFGQGFSIGIRNEMSNVESATKDMAMNSIKTLNTARELITSVLEDDFTPVITPVLDISNISDSLSGFDNLSVSMAVDRANVVSSSGVSTQTVQNGTNEPSAATTYQFNQYNTSPKALSRIEIYRQTKNLISMQKEAASV